MDTITLIEQLAKFDSKELMIEMQKLFADAKGTQERLLKDILSTSSKCEYGLKFGFEKIRNVEDFRRQVPICKWSDIEPYSERMVAGEKDLIFCGDVKQFVASSGSTGKSKYIPEGRLTEVARSLVLRLRQAYDLMAIPQFMKSYQETRNSNSGAIPGRLLSLSNLTAESFMTSSGVPIKYASGLTMQQSGLGRYLAFPTIIHSVTDNEAKDYLIMRFAIEHPDISIVSGNNAGRLAVLIEKAERRREELLSDIEHGTIEYAVDVPEEVQKALLPFLIPNPERADSLRRLIEEGRPFTPATYWPNLQLCLFWLSASVGMFVNDVRPLLPTATRYMDVGYGASEAKFNIPTTPDNPAGLLSIATTFFEFLPIDGTELLMAHQLEVGKQYKLIITTWGGLYRYDIEDIVVCRGFIGTTPQIEFVTKSSEVLNISDEKVYPVEIIPCVVSVLGEYNLSLRQLQIYPDYNARNYRFFIETDGGEDVSFADTFAEKLQACMVERITLYRIFAFCGTLKPLKVVRMKRGWQNSLLEARLTKGRSLTQIKLPTLINELPDKIWYVD